MKIVKGDLLALAEAGEFEVIVQGCNCFNTMGSGIAGQISKKYPQAVEADNETDSGDRMKLGTFTAAFIPTAAGGFGLINAYTQYGTNRFGENLDLFEYTAFKLILEKLAVTAQDVNYGFPLIGCGLAGGDKERIMAMIEDFANVVEQKNCTVTVVEYLPTP